MGIPKDRSVRIVEQHKSLENMSKKKLLKEIDRLAQYGWRVQSFGWSNGFQGGWYCLMTMHITNF